MGVVIGSLLPRRQLVRELGPLDDAYRAVINASRDAEQNHAVLCAEFCRRLFLGLLPPPAFCERRHRGLARRLEPCVGVPAKRREAAVEASAASGIGGCMGQRIPGYGRPAAV